MPSEITNEELDEVLRNMPPDDELGFKPLRRINGDLVIVNPHAVATIHQDHATVIVMLNGRQYEVQGSVHDVYAILCGAVEPAESVLSSHTGIP